MAQPVLDRVAASAAHPSSLLPAARGRAALRRHTAPPADLEAPVLPRAAAPVALVPAPSAPVTVEVGEPAYGVRTVEARPGSESAIDVAARTADVIRLAFSVAVPSVGALARVVALVEDAVAAAGRDRAEVRVLLDLDVVLAADDRVARRKRSQLEYLDALAGLTWSPADTRVVTTSDRLRAEVEELARRARVDGVVLHPLGGADGVLRTLLG